MTDRTPKECSDEMLVEAVRQILDGKGAPREVIAIAEEIIHRHQLLYTARATSIAHR